MHPPQPFLSVRHRACSSFLTLLPSGEGVTLGLNQARVKWSITSLVSIKLEKGKVEYYRQCPIIGEVRGYENLRR